MEKKFHYIIQENWEHDHHRGCIGLITIDYSKVASNILVVKQKYSVFLGYKLYILLSHVAAYKVATDVFGVKQKHYVFLGYVLYILSSHVAAYKMHYHVGTNILCTGKFTILIRQGRWQKEHTQLKPSKETLLNTLYFKKRYLQISNAGKLPYVEETNGFI